MKPFAVVTLAIGDGHAELGKITHPSMRFYAQQVGADFIVISERVYKDLPLRYEKVQIRKYLDEYRRLFYIDTDAVIRGDTPNIFDLVPEEKFGAKVEYRDKKLPDLMKVYVNSGVMVISQAHKFIFDPPIMMGLGYNPAPKTELKPPFIRVQGYDQAHINYRLQKNPDVVFELPPEFNLMPLIGKKCPEELWKKAYVVHFANVEVSADRKKVLLQKVIEDWSKESK